MHTWNNHQQNKHRSLSYYYSMMYQILKLRFSSVIQTCTCTIIPYIKISTHSINAALTGTVGSQNPANWRYRPAAPPCCVWYTCKWTLVKPSILIFSIKALYSNIFIQLVYSNILGHRKRMSSVLWVSVCAVLLVCIHLATSTGE